MKTPYDDILHLPHHVSTDRTRMPPANRAAQFAPFAALTGYDAAIIEMARLTDQRIDLAEDMIAELDMKLRILADMSTECREATITYFQEDERKDGGEYVKVTSAVKSIITHQGMIVLMGGERIAIEDILDIDSELFNHSTFGVCPGICVNPEQA